MGEVIQGPWIKEGDEDLDSDIWDVYDGENVIRVHGDPKAYDFLYPWQKDVAKSLGFYIPPDEEKV